MKLLSKNIVVLKKRILYEVHFQKLFDSSENLALKIIFGLSITSPVSVDLRVNRISAL